MSDRVSPILLVFRLRRINLVDPLEYPAPEVQDPLEADRSQEIGGFCASSAHLALHDELFVGVELRIATRNLAQRDQLRSWNAVDLPLVWLADVDDPELLA